MNEDIKVYRSGLALTIAVFFGSVGILLVAGSFAVILVPPHLGGCSIRREGSIYATAMFMMVSVPMISGAICALLYYFLRRIKLSESGVTSRDWLGRVQVAARWDEVTDFYFLGGARREYRTYRVETVKGAITFPRHFGNPDEFCDEVARRACGAKVSEWLAKGTREFELPKTFNYKGQSKPLLFLFIIVMSIVLVSGYLWCWLETARKFRTASWVESATDIVPLVLVSPIPGLALLMAAWRLTGFRLLRLHQEDEIIADASCLTLRSLREHVKLNWSEISEYFIIRRGFLGTVWAHVVRSPTGEIEFYPTPADAETFREWLTLKNIIERKAINARPRRWRTPGSRLIGGESARWDEGRRVYSYRTRDMRALCAFWGILFSLVAARPLVVMSKGSSPSLAGWIAPLSIGLGGPLVIWLGWKAIASIRIVTDENGVTYESCRKMIAADWEDVTDYYDKKLWERASVVETMRGAFRFWGVLADYEELKDEIEEKAVRAKSKEWRKR